MDNTCKSCKHWDTGPDFARTITIHDGYADDVGVVHKQCDMIEQGKANDDMVNIDYGEDGCILYTGPNFGCIHFEQKE